MPNPATAPSDPERLTEHEPVPDLHTLLVRQLNGCRASLSRDELPDGPYLPGLTARAVESIKVSGDDSWLAQESVAAASETPNLQRFINYMPAMYHANDKTVVAIFGGRGKNTAAFKVGAYLALAVMRAYATATGMRVKPLRPPGRSIVAGALRA